MFVYLNLAVSWFDKKDFHQSIRNLNKLYVLNGYASADRSLQFKIAIAELMIRYELKDFDVLESKIRQVKKDFREFITRQVNSREILMISVITKLIELDSLKQEKQLLQKWSNLFSAQKKKMEVILRFSITKPGWKKNCLSKELKHQALHVSPLNLFWVYRLWKGQL